VCFSSLFFFFCYLDERNGINGATFQQRSACLSLSLSVWCVPRHRSHCIRLALLYARLSATMESARGHLQRRTYDVHLRVLRVFCVDRCTSLETDFLGVFSKFLFPPKTRQLRALPLAHKKEELCGDSLFTDTYTCALSFNVYTLSP
jgi:hypothetical protein